MYFFPDGTVGRAALRPPGSRPAVPRPTSQQANDERSSPPEQPRNSRPSLPDISRPSIGGSTPKPNSSAPPPPPPFNRRGNNPPPTSSQSSGRSYGIEKPPPQSVNRAPPPPLSVSEVLSKHSSRTSPVLSSSLPPPPPYRQPPSVANGDPPPELPQRRNSLHRRANGNTRSQAPPPPPPQQGSRPPPPAREPPGRRPGNSPLLILIRNVLCKSLFFVSSHASIKDFSCICIYSSLKPLRFSLLYPGMGFVMHPLLLLPRPACKAVAPKIPMRAAGGPHHLSRPVANPRHIRLHHHLYATDTPLSLGLSLVSMKGSQTGLYKNK